jgi:hypothetical protein
MVAKLGGRIVELEVLGFGFGDFDQCRWVVPPFEKVFAWKKRPSN